MTERLLIAGSGGQGIMLLGKILAGAAMREGKAVTWLPAYGAEVRGGTSFCMVVISDEEIGSPYIDKADSLIMMNEPSFEKYKKRINKDALLIANTSLIPEEAIDFRHSAKHPFTDIALKLGDIRIANMVALGCFIAHKKIIKPESIIDEMRAFAPKDKPELVEINTKALEEGIKLK